MKSTCTSGRLLHVPIVQGKDYPSILTYMHDGLKDTVHHDVLQKNILTDVVSGCQDDEQQAKTEIFQTSCSQREESEH